MACLESVVLSLSQSTNRILLLNSWFKFHCFMSHNANRVRYNLFGLEPNRVY